MSSDSIDLSKLSIERLKTFCQVVESGSFVQAARRNPSKQSQFSRQIRDLERALSVRLFSREGRQLRLTPEGVRLAALTNAYFGSLRQLADSDTGALPPIRIGASESIIRWFMVPRLAEVLAAAEGQVELENHRTESLVAKLESGQLDLAVIRSDAKVDAIELAPFPPLRHLLMVPRAILPDKSAAGISAIKVLPLVSISGDGKLVQTAERLLETNGLLPKVVCKVQSFSLAIEAAKTLGVAVFVPLFAEIDLSAEQFTAVPLKGIESMNRSLSLGYSRRTADLNPRAKRAATRLARTFGG